MPLIIHNDFYTVRGCRNNPTCYYVFGDNAMRYGKRGQAVIRDEPNALGIATKMSPRVYMSDDALTKNIQIIEDDVAKIIHLLDNGEDVYWPKDGIGTGLARLEQKAPDTWKHLQDIIKCLFDVYT